MAITQAGQESRRVPACWLPAPGEERGGLQQQVKPCGTPRYPGPAWVLSAHAARKKRRANNSARAGTALRMEASSSDLPSSRLLEEPRRCGPGTEELLRNLKEKRDGLSCAGREGRAGVQGSGCTGGGPTERWKKAHPKPATGQRARRMEHSQPCLPLVWLCHPMGRSAPLGVSELWPLRRGATAAPVHGAAAVRRNLFFPCSVISPPCTVPSSESAEE